MPINHPIIQMRQNQNRSTESWVSPQWDVPGKTAKGRRPFAWFICSGGCRAEGGSPLCSDCSWGSASRCFGDSSVLWKREGAHGTTCCLPRKALSPKSPKVPNNSENRFLDLLLIASWKNRSLEGRHWQWLFLDDGAPPFSPRLSLATLRSSSFWLLLSSLNINLTMVGGYYILRCKY